MIQDSLWQMILILRRRNAKNLRNSMQMEDHFERGVNTMKTQ